MSQIAFCLAEIGLNRSPWTTLGLVVLILDIAVIVSVIAGKGTAAHKIIWSLVVLLMPIVGLILYFFIGRSRADRPMME